MNTKIKNKRMRLIKNGQADNKIRNKRKDKNRDIIEFIQIEIIDYFLRHLYF